SARIAMQGVQPKGLDENNMSINPVGKTIKSIFPFYLENTSLGGTNRKNPLKVEELTIDDLQRAIMDVRLNANNIYNDIYKEFAYVTDINRSLQPEWITEARETLQFQQESVVADLEEKIEQAPEKASDEFMYQDKAEAQRELEVAKKILDDIPAGLTEEDLKYRVWNILPYHRYRGSDEEDEE